MPWGKQSLQPITLRYEGLFDFDGMYAAITDWGKNYGYMWHEKEYKHKVPTPAGAEQEITWIMTKEVTEYIRYQIEVHTRLWELTEVEVEQNGRKRPLTNARLYVIMNGTVHFDWQGLGKRAKGFLAKFLAKNYDDLLMKNLSNHMDTLYYREWDLHALIKKYFDMQSKKYAYKGYLGEN